VPIKSHFRDLLIAPRKKTLKLNPQRGGVEASMSLFKKIAQKFTGGAGESGELKKIRIEAEQRRTAKSSASLPQVEEDQVTLKKTINQLSKRIVHTETKKPKT